LTIKLDDDVITRAKRYAKNRKTSISKMVESYLDSVTKPDSKKIKITPLVKSLSGVINLPLTMTTERITQITLQRNTMKKLFLDTNIILDLLANRMPFYTEAAELFFFG